MEFQKCTDCGSEYLFRRRRCPECGSVKFESVEYSKGTVVDSVALIASPDPFPDQYIIVLFKTEGGSMGFCRTDVEMNPGMEIQLKNDESGPVCARME